MTPFDEFSKRYRGRIEKSIAEFCDSRDKPPSVAGLYPLLKEYCLRPGKRIRPLMLLLGMNAYGGSIEDEHVRIAAVIEIMHAYLLIHDDIVDNAESRRGKEAFHKILAASVGSESGGVYLGIVAGDMFLFDCLSCLYSDECSPVITPQFMPLFARCYERTCTGQYIDVQGSFSPFPDSHEAMDIARLKTSYYTITYPFLMGMVLAGSDLEDNQALAESALVPLGLCFQLRDDIIGSFAHSDMSGKPASSDLAESKNTLLVSEALNLMNDLDRTEFIAIFKKQDKSSEEIERLKDILLQSSVLDSLKVRMQNWYFEYQRSSKKLTIHPAAAKVLDDIALRISTFPDEGRKNENL